MIKPMSGTFKRTGGEMSNQLALVPVNQTKINMENMKDTFSPKGLVKSTSEMM